MMADAARWDRFLALVTATQAPWPQGESDTDEYRRARALEFFNLALPVCHDLKELKPTGITWVPHIMLFIVPRQMVTLGDPARRSCDACESFGAMVKKLIKFATCRRRIGSVHLINSTPTAFTPTHHSCAFYLPLTASPPSLQLCPPQAFDHVKRASAGTTARRWKQSFTVGYIQQAFTRACVRESLRHGEANAPYMQRADRVLVSKGKGSVAVSSKLKSQADGESPVPIRSIYSACAEIQKD